MLPQEICLTCQGLADEEMLRAMPVDPKGGPQLTRYCPWASTGAGCPRLSSCPLSHRPLPPELVTNKFRVWAPEGPREGWIGEAFNAPFARVHAL